MADVGTVMLAAPANAVDCAANTPLTVPFPVGVNTTLAVHELPGAMEEEHEFCATLKPSEAEMAKPVAVTALTLVNVAI